MRTKLNWILGCFLILGSVLFPYGELKTNRISAGTLIYFNQLTDNYFLLFGLVCIIGLILFLNNNRSSIFGNLITQITAVGLPLLILFGLSVFSNGGIVSTSTMRTSLGLGFYLLFFGSLFCQSAFPHFKWWFLLSFLAFFMLVVGGYFGNLGLVKEFLNSRSTIFSEILRHLLLASTSALFAIFPGISLGYLSFKYQRSTEWIMGFVNLFQVAPTLSLLALVMLPLSALSQMLPWLASLGIKGIGFAPAFIVLTLYCLLPIVANTYAGFQQIDGNIIISARGMGMTNRQVFSQISLPLASPAIVSGIRTAVTQNIGNAVLAGLVGGGGMGTIIFLGLSQSAPDLVILGAIPVVLMAVLFDQIFESFERFLIRKMGRTDDRYNPSH